MDKHGTTFIFSSLVPLNESLWFLFNFFLFHNSEYGIIRLEMVQWYHEYHLLHLPPSAFASFSFCFTFSFHSRGEERTEGMDVAHFLSPLTFKYCRPANWSQAAFVWINSVSAMHPWSKLYSPIWVLSNNSNKKKSALDSPHRSSDNQSRGTL